MTGNLKGPSVRYMSFILIAAFTATACNDATTDRSVITAEETGQVGAVEPAEVALGSATTQAGAGNEAGGLNSSPVTPSSTAVTRDPPPLSLTMPEGIRGKWRRSTGSTVTAAQCVDSANDNMGKILTIRADGFSRFEDGGRLIRVQERDSSRIRATFDTTYADTPTQGEFVFDAQDNGQTLIERQYGDGAQPGIFRYRRCPAS